MPWWLHVFLAAMVATMIYQIVRATRSGRIMDSMTDIDKETSPRYFAFLKYLYIFGLLATAIFWAAASITFGIR